jgi:hypothetical protein
MRISNYQVLTLMAVMLSVTGCSSRTDVVRPLPVLKETRSIADARSGLPMYEFRAKVVTADGCGRPTCFGLAGADGKYYEPFMLPGKFRQEGLQVMIRATDRSTIPGIAKGKAIHVINIDRYQDYVTDRRLAVLEEN